MGDERANRAATARCTTTNCKGESGASHSEAAKAPRPPHSHAHTNLTHRENRRLRAIRLMGIVGADPAGRGMLHSFCGKFSVL